jgi:adenosine kinase
MNIVITGSIAYDYLMTFPGSFSEQILPDHLSRLSVSFLVDSMDKRRGGCAPNIAYTLALLGERPRLMGTAGQDFGEYRQWLEAAGIDTTLVKEVAGKFTASFFCNTDRHNNQIASFYTGAMANAGELSFRSARCDLAIIAPNDPAAMVQYAEECRALRIRHIYDPGQQCARSTADELRAGIIGASILIVNDYEFELVRQKTGLSEQDVLARSEALIITRGEKGSSILLKSGQIDIPVVPEKHIADPTGVGDAYRGGLLKGLACGASWEVAGRMGSVAATYALEHVGAQSHTYTWQDFIERYEQHFGALQLSRS